MITVGASDMEGNPYINSNYGAGSVDVFAPGVQLYTTVRGDNYRKSDGHENSGSGGHRYRCHVEILLSLAQSLTNEGYSSAYGSADALSCVPFPHDQTNSEGAPTGGYDQLCVSGGIIDAVAAVKLACEICKGK